jgi:prophage regulatory protein
LNEQTDAQARREAARRKQDDDAAAGAAGDPYHRGRGRLLTFPELKPRKGINFSAQWTSKLIRDGLFPRPIKLGSGPNGTNFWIEAEIDAWIAAKAAERMGAGHATA